MIPLLGQEQTAFADSDSTLFTSTYPNNLSERKIGSKTNVTAGQVSFKSL